MNKVARARQLIPHIGSTLIDMATNVRMGRHPFAPDVRDVAKSYMKKAGIPFDPNAHDEYVPVDENRAKRIADAFDEAKHAPDDPQVKAAYGAFAQETRNQYDHLIRHGYKMIPWAGEGQPYKNSGEFTKDVREKRRLFYFKTEKGFGEGEKPDHPLLEDAGRITKDSAGRPFHQTHNDLFRAVHDIFGHSAEGLTTGPRGEENAWRQHARMYSPLARRAMTSETRGQNSWVNFGKHLRRPDGSIPKNGDRDFVPLQDRPYSDQKAMLLPKEFSQL